jgi:hypothetical protein
VEEQPRGLAHRLASRSALPAKVEVDLVRPRVPPIAPENGEARPLQRRAQRLRVRDRLPRVRPAERRQLGEHVRLRRVLVLVPRLDERREGQAENPFRDGIVIGDQHPSHGAAHRLVRAHGHHMSTLAQGVLELPRGEKEAQVRRGVEQVRADLIRNLPQLRHRVREEAVHHRCCSTHPLL